uniref:O-acyltransferase n=1 Tax=Lotharella oceanica TaxID=641309 RepID=A0A7S2U2R0_9EUKA|mmetsp:Transcript_7374/g.14435  ORF Transcript_7374/g.14435 Transcript_7374/m.14435 type:complete len:421 (+) Transcript_7374:282-1544(+)
MLLLAINFHAQLIADIWEHGLRFNYLFLMEPAVWHDVTMMWYIIFVVAAPLALLSYSIANLLLTSNFCSRAVTLTTHAAFVLTQIALPHMLLIRDHINPIVSGIASAASTCFALKTHSYFVRRTLNRGGAAPGDMLEIGHFMRFLFVPELVYDEKAMNKAYKGTRVATGRPPLAGDKQGQQRGGGRNSNAIHPRSSSRGIRCGFVFWNWVQGIACLGWIAVVFCQQIAPVLIEAQTLVGVHSLQICVPANLCWFLAFYCVFKANFSILAELTNYPVRRFYSDWWNATTVEDFWRRWNVPVHQFAVHHIFHPCINELQMSPRAAGATVFVLSALLHELTFAVAFECPNCYFISLGMVLQVPLVEASKNLEGSRRGNILVWLNFVLGITAMAHLYFYQWHRCCSDGDLVFQSFYRDLTNTKK